MYMLLFGEFSDQFTNMEGAFLIKVLFILSTMFLCVIMINVTVAILSTVYNRVMDNKETSDFRQLCILLQEYEQLYFWRRCLKKYN